ncbi:hypothetical protein L596_007102 [Steinernema carpocapsae]|uniref:Homeobox domain-containing protein n=1 Tax=Steinernema carpocapsae TaxID=34508 RepID=A0A4V6A5W3_STECR|nr:hypothetical protein L596_007102 [Steinernema carpocapsae]
MMCGLPQTFGAPSLAMPLLPGHFVAFPAYGVPQGTRTSSSSPVNGTSILQKWLDENMEYPYPNNHEKAMLAKKTQKSPVQINNWFANARRRIKKQGIRLKSPSSTSSSPKTDSDASRSPSPQISQKRSSPSAFSIDSILNSPPVPFDPISPYPFVNTMGMLPFNLYLASALQMCQQISPASSPSV